MSGMRVVFMGTPEFAVPSLQILVEHGINVVGVLTAPDKPKGRGKKLAMSPVKEYALSQNLNILQPTNLKDENFQNELSNLRADLQVVVAFRMLPEAVWNMPPKGTFNLHASLLPQYRGAAPIHWAVINGEEETGVTTFFLKHEIDTGSIIFQEKEPISPTDTTGAVYERLMHKGAKLVLKTVNAVEEGNYPQIPQEESGNLKPAPKIFKETCEVDWNNSAENIRNFVRGLNPFPTAWTKINDKQVKLFDVSLVEKPSTKEPGAMETDGKSFLHFHTGDHRISVDVLQWEGKKKMGIQEFLRGNTL